MSRPTPGSRQNFPRQISIDCAPSIFISNMSMKHLKHLGSNEMVEPARPPRTGFVGTVAGKLSLTEDLVVAEPPTPVSQHRPGLFHRTKPHLPDSRTSV